MNIGAAILSGILLTPLLAAGSTEVVVSPEMFDQRPIDKYALIIAVEQYHEFPSVANAIDDAYAIARALSTRDFSLIRVVTERSTAEQMQFHINALAQHAQVSSRPAIVFFYFAGHGFRDGAFSYIVPSTATKGSSKEGAAQLESLRESSILVQDILASLKPELGSFTAVFIDACRKKGPQGENLPITSGMQNAIGGVLHLSTKADQLAQSRSLSNASRSPYSIALERHLSTSRFNFARLLEKAGQDVMDDTVPPQVPELINPSEASSEFYLSSPHPDRAVHLSLLQSILRMEHPKACLRKFLNRLPASPFARSAFDFYEASGAPIDSTCPEIDI